MTGRSIPDIPTLRAICHRGKLEKDRRPWYAGFRKMAIYITWLLIHTGITANQVTLLSVFLSVAGTLLLAMPAAWLALCGASAFLAHHLLDKVDGDIARFRKTFSIVGVYLDEVGHGLAFAGIFLGLGLHLAWGARTAGEAILVLGAASIGALSMVLARQNKSAGFLVFAQYVLVQPALLPDRGTAASPHLFSRDAVHRSRRGEAGEAQGAGAEILTGLRDSVLLLSDFTVILLLVLVGLVIELFHGQVAFLRVVLVAGAILQATVLLALIWINYSTNVETECLRLNALLKSRDRRTRDE